MSAFEFSFTLFGLVLGLSLAEILGGFARVLRARSPRSGERVAIRIGWFTPALALVVTLDLITAWNAAWRTLGDVPVNAATLTIGLVETGLYFVAATLLWPDEPGGWPDLDEWFDRHRAQIGAALFIANIGFSLVYIWRDPHHYDDLFDRYTQLLYLVAAAALTLSRRRWLSAVALAILLAILFDIVIAQLF